MFKATPRESILLPEVFQKQYVPASRCSDTDSLQKSEMKVPIIEFFLI